MKAIVAMAENRVIGAGGKIPWHLPEDFRFFKNTTWGHTIVMGRKTYESLGRPLPGRRNIVLTKSSMVLPGVTVIHAPDELLAQGLPSEEIFIIGGAEIYRLFLPACDTLLVTHVKKDVAGDTFFPAFEDEFTSSVQLLTNDDFTIREYQRK